MGVRVGSWDCSYCKTESIPGYVYDCLGCGHPRPRGVKFYLLPDAPYTTPEQKNLMGTDPNWYCSSCESGNKDENSRCWNCGAPRGFDSVQHERRVYQPGEAPSSTAEAVVMEKTVSPEPEIEYAPEDDPYNPQMSYSVPEVNSSSSCMQSEDFSPIIEVENKTPWPKYSLIAAGILSVLLLVYFFFIRTTEQIATVEGFSWSRSVAIEEYQTFHEEGWSIPFGGRVTGSTVRQSGTVKITDGWHSEDVPDTCYETVHHSQTCSQDDGNGGFSDVDCSYDTSEPYSCSKTIQVEDYHYDPVYDTWYFYDIERWTVISKHPTSGQDHKPYYDQVQPSGDKQRRVEEQGDYTVYFVCDGIDPFDRKYDLSLWNTFDYGQEHVVKINAFKIVLEVK